MGAPAAESPSSTFDLVLLGLGSDGHTASLFPKPAALDETIRWVVKNPVPQLKTDRVTFHAPALINMARYVLFLVLGADKAGVLSQVIDGTASTPGSSLLSSLGP